MAGDSSKSTGGGLATVGSSGSDQVAASGSGAALPSGSRGGSPAAMDVSNPKWLGKRIGRFRLIGVIGKGAMGKVFRAEDIQLHRLVALKVISSRSSKKRTAAQKHEQFMREGRSAAKLEHPNIVSVFEVNSAGDIHYIAMELIEGGNLKDLVVAAGPLDVGRACQLAADAAEALQHAHEQSVIHRDVKPANLMLTRSGRCKLGDFGLARQEDLAEVDTGLSTAVGTPLFVSPEVALGDEATPLSDVYSLGATLYYLLTGTPPFPGDNSQEVLRRHVEELPPDIRTVRPDVPESLALAIWRAMAKQPTARFESAGHFARALRLHTIQFEAAAEMTTATEAKPSWQLLFARHRALIALLGGGLCLALVIAIAVLANRSSSSGRAKQNTGDASGSATAATEAKNFLDPPYLKLPLPSASQVIEATNAPLLMRVAAEPDPSKHNGKVIVEGWVLRWVGEGDGVRTLYFRGADRRRGLVCRIPAKLVPTLTTHFGGDPQVRLADQRVQVQGSVELNDGQPEITLSSVDQISVR